MSKLLPTNVTSDSNLFLIEFILRWPKIILCGFWFLSCMSSQMSLVFLSIIGSIIDSGNLKQVYLYLLSSDAILSDQDVEH